MRPVIILFAKAPTPGRVKTRLQPLLPPEAAADLHRCFVQDMLDMLAGVQHLADVELHTDILTDAWPDRKVAARLQADGDLGLKMFYAMRNALSEGRPRAMVLGSDAPTLPPAHVEELLASQADVAMGPSEDGGYYGISCRRVHPKMFEGVRWSGPRTLKDTLRAVSAQGLSTELGRSWFDVDSPEDLRKLSEATSVPPHTAGYLKKMKW